jgi:hypothetical protein
MPRHRRYEDQKEQARKQKVAEAKGSGEKKVKGERAAKQARAQANKDRVKKRKRGCYFMAALSRAPTGA